VLSGYVTEFLISLLRLWNIWVTTDGKTGILEEIDDSEETNVVDYRAASLSHKFQQPAYSFETEFGKGICREQKKKTNNLKQEFTSIIQAGARQPLRYTVQLKKRT
jgi:hypothetical protein